MNLICQGKHHLVYFWQSLFFHTLTLRHPACQLFCLITKIAFVASVTDIRVEGAP